MRSASAQTRSPAIGLLVVCGVLLIGALGGCATTQDTATAKQARIEAHPRRRAKRSATREDRHDKKKGEREAMNAQLQDKNPVAGRYEPCEECGAPMDPQQRYCVNCAARRGNGANPSSRYFAAMNKERAGRRPARRQSRAGSRAAAVGFFALLPIAVAIGVVVGNARRRGGDGGEEALLQALREQEVGARPPPPAPRRGDATGKSKDESAKADESAGRTERQSRRPDRRTATVHEITGFKPSKRRKKRHQTGRRQTPNRSARTTSRRSRTCPT